MKRIFLGLMALAMTFSAMSQDNKKHGKKSSNNKEWNKEDMHSNGDKFEKLNLTEDQKAQMKSMQLSFRQQMKDVSTNGTAEEQKQKRNELARQQQEKMMSILTPDQRKQAVELRKDYMTNKKDGTRGGRFNNITQDLNLDAEQSAKVAGLNATFKSNLESLKNNTTLSQDEKKEQIKNLTKKHKSDVQSLLTNDQKKQLKNQRKNRHDSDAVK
jgi:Spy/CpxP family protein refolding chaperone